MVLRLVVFVIIGENGWVCKRGMVSGRGMIWGEIEEIIVLKVEVVDVVWCLKLRESVLSMGREVGWVVGEERRRSKRYLVVVLFGGLKVVVR